MSEESRKRTSDPTYRRVTVKRDNVFTYPDMWLSVFIAGTRSEEAQFAELFVRGHCRKAEDVESADIVVFTGGADVDPTLYGEVAHKKTHTSPLRDKQDIALYWSCYEAGVPMIGICRGAQFLHVMNGGKLYQDVNGHYGDHEIWDVKRGIQISKVSSVHHQMVIDNTEGGMDIIAYAAGVSTERHLNPTTSEVGTGKDIEAFFYRETCCLGFQGHPEYSNYGGYSHWFLETVNQVLNENPDLGYETKMPLRMKKELLEQRQDRIVGKEPVN